MIADLERVVCSTEVPDGAAVYFRAASCCSLYNKAERIRQEKESLFRVQVHLPRRPSEPSIIDRDARSISVYQLVRTKPVTKHTQGLITLQLTSMT